MKKALKTHVLPPVARLGTADSRLPLSLEPRTRSSLAAMTSRMHRFALAFASLLMGLGQARAETPAETAAAFGLLGTWAVDCRMPPSVANGYLTYARTPGAN